MTDKKIAKVIAEEVQRAHREEDEEEKEFEYFRVPPAKDPSQIYSIRISVDKLERLRVLAKSRGLSPSALIRELVEARLDAERGGAVVTVTLAEPVFKSVTDAAKRAGISVEDFAQQSIALVAGARQSGASKAKRRPPKKRAVS